MKNFDAEKNEENEELNKEKEEEQRPKVHFDENQLAKKETTKEVVLKVLKEIGNFKLLKENKMFLMIFLSNFFSFLCYFTPFHYIPMRAENLGLKNFALIISIIGNLN